MITISIDVTKVEKARLVEKNGAKYLSLVLQDSINDKYGNDFVVRQGCTKEERAQGLKMPIIGNGKDWSKSNTPKPKPVQQAAPATAQSSDDDGDAVPF
jgi:hypothetical protein